MVTYIKEILCISRVSGHINKVVRNGALHNRNGVQHIVCIIRCTKHGSVCYVTSITYNTLCVFLHNTKGIQDVEMCVV